MSKPDNDSDYEADFTTEQAGNVICERERCRKAFPPGTRLKWLHNKDPMQPGRKVCDDCFQHYRSKETTRRRSQPRPADLSQSYPVPSPNTLGSGSGFSAPVHPPAVGDLESHSIVHQQVAAAQRNDGAYPVVAVGNTQQMSQSVGKCPVGLMARFGQDIMVNPGPSQLLSRHTLPPRPFSTTNTPVNVIPSRNSGLTFPALKSKALVNPGYQEAHQLYNEMRTYFANKAYSTVANAELVVVKVWMMMRVPLKKNAVPVSDIFEALSDIPVHIGLNDLKWILYHALLPRFIKWSKGFTLSLSECEVRNKHWVELVPRNPDVDAIADHFFSFKGKNKMTKVFSPKQGIDLYLAISHEKYEAVLQHLSDVEESSQYKPLIGENGIPACKNKRKMREFDDETGESTITASRIETTTQPTPDQVKHALQLQVPPRKKNMKSLFETVIVNLQFFRPPSNASFKDLVENPELLLHPEKFAPIQAVLSYCPSSNPLKGAFKIAHFGYTSTPLFGTSTQVCIKQTFYMSDGLKKPIVYQGQTQATNLSVELNCLGWASALMDLVYRFMKKEERLHGQPPFTVPHMRYVQSGLAISKELDDKFSAYLLEEFIDSEGPGNWFVKYLNNNSARPYMFHDDEKSIRAEFLSFAQHVQYVETGGLAFVSDFQGGRTLLTDPQIITNPTLVGFLFGEGNTNFEMFTEEHTCNRFCKFYQLRQPTAQTHIITSANIRSDVIAPPVSDSASARNPLSISYAGTAPMDISTGV